MTLRAAPLDCATEQSRDGFSERLGAPRRASLFGAVKLLNVTPRKEERERVPRKEERKTRNIGRESQISRGITTALGCGGARRLTLGPCFSVRLFTARRGEPGHRRGEYTPKNFEWFK